MPRRRLRLTCSSDDEENQIQNPNPNPNQIHCDGDPVTISDDDDFVDVSDNLSTPSPPPLAPAPPPPPQPEPEPTTAAAHVNPSVNTGSPIGDLLVRMGLRLKNEWLDSCVRGLEGSVPGFARFDLETKAKLCFEQFLFSDMNRSGGGVLPENVHSMHLVDLKGPFVLQVDEIVNISCPLRGRYQDASSGIKRSLKLSMTDGFQRVFGMEYRPINDLKVFAPAGLKVAIGNVHIRRGLLMLVPEAFEVLGGMVEELEAARQRLVNEVNKPPRGKRTRTGVIPPLATRATHAAWSTNGVDLPGHTNSSTSQQTTPLQADEQGATLVGSHTYTGQRTMESSAVSSSAEIAMLNLSSGVVSDVEEMHIDTVPVSRTDVTSNLNSNVEMHVDTFPVNMTDAACDSNSNAEVGAEDVHMVNKVEHPLILFGDREIPFTYMASLSAKWASIKEKAPSVQGKIKCFLTGVKGFQYKQRATYELEVYVDDGSLISEILIDHSVVQKGIGYSPEEVTAALSSSDKKIAGDMKNTLRQFQKFLVNFEGTMLVEINKNRPLPIALEMSQGCPASDAWLLLRRLKSFAPAQVPQCPPFEPIDISP